MSNNTLKKFKKNARLNLLKMWKEKHGILLELEEGVETYDCIQWWHWIHYGTPNNTKLSVMPKFCYSEQNIFKICKPIITIEIGFYVAFFTQCNKII